MAYPIPTPTELGNNHAARRMNDAQIAHGDKSNIQKIRDRPETVSFWDFVDVINPLQHIPIVSTIYRGLTGDAIAPAARIAGGALFGGFIGAAISTANVFAEMKTDRDIGENVMKKLDVDLAEKGLQKDETHEVLPVVEVRPVAGARPQAPVIFWDDEMPIVMAASGGPSEKIIWDDAKSSATHMASITPAAGTSASEKLNDEMVFASAMPTPKELNDLEPGVPFDAPVATKTTSQNVTTHDELPEEVPVPQAMAQALEKYAAMQSQKMDPSIIQPAAPSYEHNGEIFIPAVNHAAGAITAQPADGQKVVTSGTTPAVRDTFQGFRRYR